MIDRDGCPRSDPGHLRVGRARHARSRSTLSNASPLLSEHFAPWVAGGVPERSDAVRELRAGTFSHLTKVAEKLSKAACYLGLTLENVPDGRMHKF